jgi:hypothetical protein
MTKRAFPIPDSYYDVECINLTIRQDLSRSKIAFRDGTIATAIWDLVDEWASRPPYLVDVQEASQISLLAQMIARERLYDKDYEQVTDLMHAKKDHPMQVFKSLCRRKMHIQGKRNAAKKEVVHQWEVVTAFQAAIIHHQSLSPSLPPAVSQTVLSAQD